MKKLQYRYINSSSNNNFKDFAREREHEKTSVYSFAKLIISREDQQHTRPNPARFPGATESPWEM